MECRSLARNPEKGSNWPEGAECLTLDFGPHRETVFQWRRLPDCDEFVGARRSKHTMVGYKGAIYVFGGDNGKQMLNDLIRFDPSDNSWGRAFTMGQMPAPRYHHSAVVYESSMYIFGGYTGDIHSNSNLTNKNDLFEYKFSTGQWSEILCEGSDARKPPARSAHAAAVFGGQMFVFGGFDGFTRLNDMWTISLKGPLHRWEEVTQIGECPPPCCNFAMAVVKDCMYLFSGQSGARTTNSLFQFHFPTRSWSRISTEHILRGSPSPPDRRYGHSMVPYDRHIFLFGGAADSIHSSDLHVFDLETQIWSIVEVAHGSKIPSRRLFHASVVVNDGMYMFGGTVDNNIRSNELYRFHLASYPRCTLHDDFGRLLESRQLCDLRFLVGKDKVPIYAHVAIVAARSGYLLNKIKAARDQAPEQPQQQADPSSSTSTAATAVPPIAGPPVACQPLPEVSSLHSLVGAATAVQDALPVASPNLPPGKAIREASMLDVHVPDAEPFAFEMVLDYMYTDKIDPTKRGQEPESNGVVLRMMDVYRLSLQLSMKRLEGLCVQYLELMIGLRNVLAALQNASRLNLNYIKEFCLKFITKESNYNQIVMSKEFETLEQPLMVEIIRRRQIPALRPAPEGPAAAGIQGPTLEDDMRAFLDGRVGAEFCDLTLMCQGTAVPVHKVILAARSGYFEAMFRSFMPETNTVTVCLGEVFPSHHSFQSLLKYIYYGDIHMPPEDSLYLFSAPFFYSFTNNRLQVFCKENLETNIRWDNVVEILEAADQIQANEMKKHCLRLIVQHFTQVSALPKLRELSKELLLDIIGAVSARISMATALSDEVSSSTAIP